MTTQDWLAIVTAGATIVYTIGTFLLWRTTQTSVKLLGEQVSKDIAISQSNAYHSIIDAHRELWLRLIMDPRLAELCGLLDDDNSRRDMIASLLINHCSRIFIDYEAGVIDKAEISGFVRDAIELFSISFVKKRWEEVSQFHKRGFAEFVNVKVLPYCRKRDEPLGRKEASSVI